MNIPDFPTDYDSILKRIDAIDPIFYGKTRNFIDGDVTYLSPYISRGVISTSFVLEKVLEKDVDPESIKKFIQELCWRDYWQQVWKVKGETINTDLKHEQSQVSNQFISKAIVDANTGISTIDDSISNFYKSGYLHNHVRMYIASIACNIGKSHWKHPAKWMYYHLLDGDWASNALSWQWVAGTFSNKKYVANQENINKYCHTSQSDTFLHVSYDNLPLVEIPKILEETIQLKLQTKLPESDDLQIDSKLPTYIFNSYNLDPNWDASAKANRILLLEPSHFEDYPVSEQSINFILELKKNIEGCQVFVGEFQELKETYRLHDIQYKEHPLSKHYEGKETPRDWILDVEGYFPSFFKFWNKGKSKLFK